MFQNRFFFAVFSVVLSFSSAFVHPIFLPAANSQVVYSTDFETGVSPEWLQSWHQQTPSGRWFFGQFGNHTVTLTLGDLPTHAETTISFDLFIIRSWDGNHSGVDCCGPDIWDLSVVDGPTLFHTTFSNGHPDTIAAGQAFPGAYPGAFYPSETGAAEVNELGYPWWDGYAMDSVYHLNTSFQHTGSTLQLEFSASGLQILGDESWGLDNVVVHVDGVQQYANDFEFEIDSAWKLGSTAVTPLGDRTFLGRFQNDYLELRLDALPSHTQVTVAFDLFVIQSWDGNHDGEEDDRGPDVWDFSVVDGPTLLHTTFSNGHPDTIAAGQAYPDTFPGVTHPARTGATEDNSLGYYFDEMPMDTVYHLVAEFPHVGSTLQLAFLALGLQAYNPDDESWGLDNVQVSVQNVPRPPQNLTVTPAPGQAFMLAWEYPPADDTTFVVERRNSNACAWQPLDTVPPNTTTYTDSQLSWSDQITYRVAAQNANGASAWVESSTVSHPAVPRWQLKLYRPIGADSGMWVPLRPCDTRFNPDFGTAVIVHGWTGLGGQLNGWVRDMAKSIHGRVKPGVNVLAWEWEEEARHLFFNPLASENINPQAEYLARTLELIFSLDYPGPVHLIGHSMGSRLILIAAQSMGLHDPWVPNVFPPGQVTLLDTPDRAITRGNIVDNINTVRGMGMYVDSYYGCTNDGPYTAHVWVDVPCPTFGQCGIPGLSQCHSETHEWYRGTMQEDPILRDGPSCGNNSLGGTVGFGLSILVTDPGNPNRNRPQYNGCGLAIGTLKFSELSACTQVSGVGVFGLDWIQECEAVDPPQAVSRPLFSSGEFSDNCQFCELQTPENFFLSTGVHLPGEGGGGQVDEIIVNFSLPLTISDEWDYLSFEYDFTEMVAQATLEVTLTVGDAVYPVFLMTAEPVFEKNFLSTGLRDIRDLHGQSASLAFELRSSQVGAVVHVRDLIFWRDPWHGNHAPVADAGPDQDVMAAAAGLAQVQLDGSGSADADGDDLSYRWMIGGELLTIGEIALVEFSVGRHPVLLVVRDPAANVSTDEVVITVTGGLTFLRGDSNGDGEVDISDAVKTLFFLFVKGTTIGCVDAADTDDNGEVQLTDAIVTLTFLFLNGQPPQEPYPNRGPDLSADTLGCDSYVP